MFPLFVAFLLLSCNATDEMVAPSNSAVGMRASNNKKVDICHNGHIINVSVNAIPAHLMHGDPIDFDGDGYFSGPNNCNMPVDCDDNDGDYTNNCCVTTLYCGFLSGAVSIVVSFNGTCSTTVVYNYTPCANGPITWTLVSNAGGILTYQENNPCSDIDCIITLTPSGNSYEANFSCGQSSDGVTLNPCEQ